MSQVRKPQCFVVGLEESGFFSLSSSFEGVSSTVVGQAYFVLQSSRSTPSLKDRKCNSYNESRTMNSQNNEIDFFRARKASNATKEMGQRMGERTKENGEQERR